MKFKIEKMIIKIGDIFEFGNSKKSNIWFKPKIINPMLDIRTTINPLLLICFNLIGFTFIKLIL